MQEISEGNDPPRPSILPPDIDTLNGLAAQMPDARWCVWRLVWVRDRWSKVPSKREGRRFENLSVADHAQWGAFADACGWFKRANGEAAGLGILIGGEGYASDFVAVDIDDCLDDAGEVLSGIPAEVKCAIEALQAAGVYVERSPSGGGLRALWRGNKPQGLCAEKKSISGLSREIYDGHTKGRYVTLTGNAWNGAPASITDQPEALALDVAEWLGLLLEQKGDADGESKGNAAPRNMPALSDDKIISKVKQAGQGKGKRLWEGDLSDYGNDRSSADKALCGIIAQWSDDTKQIERIWGGSALAKRDKFEKRGDYRQRTIAGALEWARKEAGKQADTTQRKAARVKAAVEAGDMGGVLAGAVAQWGGKVPQTMASAEMILSFDKRLMGAFASDQFSGQVVKLRRLRQCLGETVPPDSEPIAGQAWTDADTADLTIWLERGWGLALKSAMVSEAIEIAARRRPINTVVDALESLHWDGVKRLDEFLVDYLNADDTHDSPRYLSAIGRAWMIGTVARAYEPGCKHDHVLTLESGQGFGKSKAVRVLAEAVAPHAFREGLPALSQGQEAERALAGIWICELAEMSFMDRATAEHVKAYMTKESDSVRLPWGRRYVTLKRTVSFAGTTNQSQFIRDNSGGRRFWVFKVGKPIDIERLHRDAGLLWAEAVTAYKAGESWYLKDPAALRDAADSQWRRVEREGFDELIEDKIIEGLGLWKLDDTQMFDWRMQAFDLWQKVAPGADANEFQKVSRSFAGALDRCGFVRKTSGGRSMVSIGERLAEAIRQSRKGAKEPTP